MQAAGVYASPRRGRRSRQPRRERSRARTPMWASRLDSLVARRRMVRRVYATRACRRKQSGRSPDGDRQRALWYHRGIVWGQYEGVHHDPAHARHLRPRRRSCWRCCRCAGAGHGPLPSATPRTPEPRLAPGARPGWSSCGPRRRRRSTLLASRFSNDGAVARPGRTVVSGITGLDGWYADRRRPPTSTVVWKAGGAVLASVHRRQRRRPRVRTGHGVHRRDRRGAARRRHGSRRSAAWPPDGSGGAYIWLHRLALDGVPASATRSSTTSPRRRRARDDSGAGARRRQAAPSPALDVDDSTGHAFALLGPPGRDGLAVQRSAPTLTRLGLVKPISPYSPFSCPSGGDAAAPSASTRRARTRPWPGGRALQGQAAALLASGGAALACSTHRRPVTMSGRRQARGRRPRRRLPRRTHRQTASSPGTSWSTGLETGRREQSPPSSGSAGRASDARHGQPRRRPLRRLQRRGAAWRRPASGC